MIERMKDIPAGIDGVKAVGKVSKEDYQRVIEPLVDDARREGRRIRFLYYLGPEFEGLSAAAAWEDAKIGLHSLRRFEACAVVSDVDWIRDFVRLAGYLIPCPVRVFANSERNAAIEWLQTFPRAAGVSHRLIADAGVIVVEVKETLRAEDFDALAVTADTWIEAHGELRGLVIHAARFPGWENIATFLRHLRFVRDHHRKIKRIALATDFEFADIMPKLADHFVQAEIRSFEYGEIESAIAWASGTKAGEQSS